MGDLNMNTLFSRVPDPRRESGSELAAEECDDCSGSSDSDNEEECDATDLPDCSAYDRLEPQVGYLPSAFATGDPQWESDGASRLEFLDNFRTEIEAERGDGADLN